MAGAKASASAKPLDLDKAAKFWSDSAGSAGRLPLHPDNEEWIRTLDFEPTKPAKKASLKVLGRGRPEPDETKRVDKETSKRPTEPQVSPVPTKRPVDPQAAGIQAASSPLISAQLRLLLATQLRPLLVTQLHPFLPAQHAKHVKTLGNMLETFFALCYFMQHPESHCASLLCRSQLEGWKYLDAVIRYVYHHWDERNMFF